MNFGGFLRRGLKSTPLGTCVPRLHACDLTKQQMVDNYIEGNIPCVISGLCTGWKASHKWLPLNFLKNYGESRFSCGENIDSNEPIIMKFNDYYQYCLTIEKDFSRIINRDDGLLSPKKIKKPLYLFDSTFDFDCPGISDDYDIPEYFVDDLFVGIESIIRPNYKWLVIGPLLSGVSLHVDPLSTCAWNSLLHGRKKWIAIEPKSKIMGSYEEDLYSLFATVCSKACEDEPVLNMVQLTSGRDFEFEYDGRKAYMFTQNAGETIFMPCGWQHAVLNLEFSVAITHNFLHPSTMLAAPLFPINGSPVQKITVDELISSWSSQLNISEADLKLELQHHSSFSK